MAWMVIGVALAVLTIIAGSRSEYFATMRWQQWTFLGHLAFPYIYWKRMQTSPRREIYMQYVAVAAVVAALYVNDALVLAYAIGSAWLYHYMSMLNVMNFLSHYSFHLYLWRHEGKLEGRRDAEVTHLREKIEMAAELHDVVGAELSQMVVLSNASGNHAGALKQLAADSLEKVRNFAHILKGEKQVAELPEMLRNLRDRLLQLGRYEVVLIENSEDVFLRDVKGSNTNRQPQSETSTLLQVSPFVRMHLERIFSEWSANVIRHAKEATRLTLGWRLKRGRLCIFFVQDATSFAWKGHADRGGLKGIERRAQEIGAKVACRRFGQGSLLLLTMPLGRPNA
jgi:signal transduction histidine kinase